ncbi:TonB-dependent receptor [Arcobacter lacus]|uniref:TonB-dependent receptor domain-containing protein n=1 Tax=Arcobacter lacus TaxID=1912876 RepID=UPI0021BAD424|nr:TonB-dependent receptor [Arcobacter lacus]MCT7908086.1 TonB-dependent receptor [Arcobacter lacus]MCT7911830.1 TonB-dependent receptor [Arcobacter lacus]
MRKIKVARSLAVLLVTNTLLNANQTTTLDDVKVVTTASGFEQNVQDAAATISVITAEELEKKSYSDVTDALKNVPGVYIQGGGSNQTILMRGMSSGYTLFLIDGKPMQGDDAFSPNASTPGTQMNFLPPIEAIERIEVVRGPASSLYGSDAMGGVINIITKKHSDKATASIRTEYIKADSSNKVNDDTTNTNIFVNAPIIKDKLSVQVTGAFLNQNESNFQGGSKATESDPKFEKKDLGGKLIFTPDENNTIKAGYTYSIQERTHTEGKSSTEDSYTKAEKYNYNLTHQFKKDKFLLDSYLNYDNSKNPSRVNATTGNGIEFDTISANSQGTYFFDNNSLTVGANYKKENLEDGATSSMNNDIVKMERYQWALFAEDTWSVIDDLALTLSGRYDYNEDFGEEFSPKAYAVYHLTDNLVLKGGVTTGYKAPSLRQAAPDYSGVSRGGVMIGNPDLTPETSINYEAGFAYDNPDIGLEGSLVAFQTDFEDKITRTSRICQPNQPCTYKGTTYASHQYGYTAYENVDKAEIKGIELTTDYYILENLKYRHSYTYTDSEQKSGANKGNPLNDISKHMFNAGLDWDVTSKLLLWTQANYRGKTGGTASDPSDKNPSYTFVDLGAVYKHDKNLQFTAGVYNVANKEVTSEDGYDYILDGRRYSVAMNLKF